jgi:hypothetical protein
LLNLNKKEIPQRKIMMNLAINTENWTLARLKQGELLAFVSSGGELSSDDKVVDVFYVVVSNLEYQEISEHSFPTLDLALQELNKKFSHWELTSLKQNTGSGCDSCAAH